MPDWSTAEWAQVIAAIAAAVAAIAAAAATTLQFLVQRRSRRPHLSHVLRGWGTVGAGLHRTEITIVNAGPGVAVSPAVMVVQPGKRWVGAFGEGHLLAGQQASLFIDAIETAKGEKLPAAYSCRDVDSNLHVWSNDGRYEHVPAREVLAGRWTVQRAFELMYPDVELPETLEAPSESKSRWRPS